MSILPKLAKKGFKTTLNTRMTWGKDDFSALSWKQLENPKKAGHRMRRPWNVGSPKENRFEKKSPKTNRKKKKKKTPDLPMKSANKFTQLLSAGFTDTFRYFYPDQKDILFVVVLPIQSERKKRRLAYRLFSCLRIAQREIVQCENTHGNFWLGPLSRGAGSWLIIIHIPLNDFSNDSDTEFTIYRSRRVSPTEGV